MKFIDDIDHAWKFASVRLSIFGIVATQVYFEFYDKLKDNIPPIMMVAITSVIFAASLLGRLIDFKKSD